jgi:hypothetical protein
VKILALLHEEGHIIRQGRGDKTADLNRLQPGPADVLAGIADGSQSLDGGKVSYNAALRKKPFETTSSHERRFVNRYDAFNSE